MSSIKDRLGSPQWLEHIGRAAGAIGTDTFYERLLDVASALLAHDKSMVVRYSRFSAPQCLTYRSYPDHVIQLWLSGHYRFDPFYGYWREREECGVTTLRMISSPAQRQTAFWQIFLRQAKISDELAIFLPAVGRSSIALFVERTRRRFTEGEISNARHAYPVLAGLHRAHVGQIFATLTHHGRGLDSVKGASCLLLVDRSGRRIHETAAWHDFEAHHRELAAAFAEVESGRQRQVAMSDGNILQVETLAADFPLAPGGTLYAIERSGLSPVQQRLEDAVAAFGDGRLTARERQIVKLILEGYPNETIAKRLGVAKGTIKNHRKRLYYKLDITSERELFTMFLSSLLDRRDQLASIRTVEASIGNKNVIPIPAVARRPMV